MGKNSLEISAPTAKFRKVGDVVEGEILDVYDWHRTEYVRGGGGRPLYWPATKGSPVPFDKDPQTGKELDPVLDLVVEVQTDLNDPNVPGDNGERRVFLKRGDVRALANAASRAMREAGWRRGEWKHEDLRGAQFRAECTELKPNDGAQDTKVLRIDVSGAQPPRAKPVQTALDIEVPEDRPLSFDDITKAIETPAGKPVRVDQPLPF